MAAIAARVGVTERTIFRHFETRDALLQVAWEKILDAASYPQTADELIELPRQRFRRWDQLRQFVRSSVYSRAALDARKYAAEPRRAMLACVQDALPILDEDTARRRAAIVELLYGPYAWEVLGELWAFSGAEAGEAVSEALAVLLGREAADLPGR